MNRGFGQVAWIPLLSLSFSGCAAPKVDFSKINRPSRSAELDAYNIFVGAWNWEAEMLNAEGPDKKWTGTAKWEWALDNRCLKGQLSSKTERTKFEATGVWSWDPVRRKYIWWMFNDWGYPQSGDARYNEKDKCWTMYYRSVGLDGTTSYGQYRMKAVDNNTLDWSAIEWADALHTITKMEMKGVYRRQK